MCFLVTETWETSGMDREGEEGEGRREGGGTKGRNRKSHARTSVSHHQKRESQQLRKAHWTENTRSLSLSYTQTGGVELFCGCVKPQ